MTTSQKELAVTNFNAAVSGEMRDSDCDRLKAVEVVATKNPGLHRDYLKATHQQYR